MSIFGSSWLVVVQTILILVTLTRAFSINGEIYDPAPEFSKHSIVHPVIHHGRTKREISSTRDTDGAHHPEVEVTVPVDGEPWVLQLRLNEHLVAPGYTMMYQEGGNTVKRVPENETQVLDLCHYSGSVRGKNGSRVAVSTCHGLQGVIFDGQRMRFIEPVQDAEISSSHYIYDHRDLINEDINDVIKNIVTESVSSRNRLERNIKKSRTSKYYPGKDNKRLQRIYRLNSSTRYVELVLVADRSMYKYFRGNMKTIERYLAKLTNIVNTVYYAPLNIQIVLVGTVVWNKRDEIYVSQNSSITLKKFLKYRKYKLIYKMHHDNVHLITRKKFLDGVLGEAYVNAMCSSESGGVDRMSSGVVGMVASTVAHEMGHNFGMLHDEEYLTQCRCVGPECVMATETNDSLLEPVANWSSCSLRALKYFFDRKFDHCLHNKPKRSF